MNLKCWNLKQDREKCKSQKTQYQKYLLVYVEAKTIKSLSHNKHELLQKCIKYSKIFLDSFLTVTTVLEKLNAYTKN